MADDRNVHELLVARGPPWPSDGREAMAALARSFPSLQGVPGTQPWDADSLVQWLCGPAPTSGSLLAGIFVLHVWNPRTRWGDYAADELRLLERTRHAEFIETLNHFDLFRAVGVFDRAHHAALMAWLVAPFFP